MDQQTQARIEAWKGAAYDEETRQAVIDLEKEDPEGLYECFYTELAFGTGGLRGKMGIGPNRMNQYTVKTATQGLANYLKKETQGSPSVAIAYDSRNNSPLFARFAAEVLAANDIKVYLYPELRPTPLLSFTVRSLGCDAGIVITASHNPKEYNGYKVYWSDGGQLLPPHDKGIIEEVRAISSPDEIEKGVDESLISEVPANVESDYYQMVQNTLQLPQDHPGKGKLKVVYTNLHGTGGTMIPKALAAAGFSQVHELEAQAEPNGDFPTVRSPNPEERDAMDLSRKKADELSADIILGTDPDTDRVGIGVRASDGEMELLNGNQAASLLVYFILSRMKARQESFERGYIAKTIVTSELLKEVAQGFGVPCYDTLTGFKYIAGLIAELDGKEQFIAGGEESYGYLIGDAVRDKDAVLSSVLLCEMAAWAMEEHGSVRKALEEIYLQFGMYRESLTSLVKEGSKGAMEIQGIMDAYRQEPPHEIAGKKVLRIADYKKQEVFDLQSGKKSSTDLPASNVIQFWTEGNVKITARPSGTEPKIKYYVSLRKKVESAKDVPAAWTSLGQEIEMIHQALGI